MQRPGCSPRKLKGGHAVGLLVAIVAVMLLAGCDFLSLLTPTTTTTSTTTTSTTTTTTTTPVFSVTYHGNGNTDGGVPVDPSKYRAGASVMVLGNTGSLAKSGYAFRGWNTAASGSGSDRIAGTSFAMGPEDVALYAKWAPSPEMLAVPGGSFQMGMEVIATPTHRVSMTGFEMGKYEITQAQYLSVTGSSPSHFSSGADAPARPVETVTWYDAVEFCNRLSVANGFMPVYTIGDRVPESTYPITSATVTRDMTRNGYRLPTEAEWEYAAKGGDNSPNNYIFSGSNDAGAVAWYSGNSESATHVGGTKAANGLGLYDMSGNVFEWCQDWYERYGSDPQSDPEGVDLGWSRVLRGGSWNVDAARCYSAFRGNDLPDLRNSGVGFRIVRRP